MRTGTLAKAKKKVNMKVFDFSNNDQNYYCFFCQGNLFAMLTWPPPPPPIYDFPARFPSELHLPDEKLGNRMHLTPGEPAQCSHAAAGRTLLCLCSGCVPVDRLSTKHKSSTKRGYCTWTGAWAHPEKVLFLLELGNVHGKPSAGKEQRAWPREDAPLLFATVLISLLDWFQKTALHWPPLHSSIKPPLFLVLSSILYVFSAQWFSFIHSGGQMSTDCAVFHPAYSCLPPCPLHGHHEQHVLTQGTSPRSAM